MLIKEQTGSALFDAFRVECDGPVIERTEYENPYPPDCPLDIYIFVEESDGGQA